MANLNPPFTLLPFLLLLSNPQLNPPKHLLPATLIILPLITIGPNTLISINKGQPIPIGNTQLLPRGNFSQSKIRHNAPLDIALPADVLTSRGSLLVWESGGAGGAVVEH